MTAGSGSTSAIPARAVGGDQAALARDPVTGLICGDALERFVDERLQSAGRQLRGKSLIVVDLDQYWQLAETYSVAHADAALQAVAERVSARLPEANAVGAFGITSIAVLTGTALLPAAVEQPVLAALREALDGAVTLPDGDIEVFLNPRIGVAVFPDHGQRARELMINAALVASQRHQEPWAFYRGADHDAARRRVEMDNLIQRGVRREEFGFLYAPRFGAGTGRMTGVEQQIVWHHPTRGAQPPEALLDEHHLRHLHELLGERALAAAVAQWRAWDDARFDPGRIALTLPGRLLDSERLPTLFRGLLRRYRVPPRVLSIELSGAALLRELTRAEDNLRALSQLGVGLTLANVGQGQSILEQVQSLPLDALKLDRSLVDGVLRHRAATALAKAGGALAQGLGIRLVADGVKSMEQLRLLTRHGCDEFQGPLVSGPLDADTLPLRFPGGLAAELTTGEGQAGQDLPRVVVVDDDQRLLRAVQRELRRGPWQLITFDRPADALQMIAENRVALLITDQRMPEMSGLELVRDTREVSPQTVCIIMSAHTDVGTLTEALNAGAVFRFLGKPWDREALRQAVTDGLAAWQGRA